MRRLGPQLESRLPGHGIGRTPSFWASLLVGTTLLQGSRLWSDRIGQAIGVHGLARKLLQGARRLPAQIGPAREVKSSLHAGSL